MTGQPATAQPAPLPKAPTELEHRVTPLELFFDLVFVFALTQVTGMLAADPSLPGLPAACSCWPRCGGRGGPMPG